MATRTTTPTDADASLPDSEEERRLPIEKSDALRALLRSWREETDPEELQDQRETWEYLKQALDENRTYRKLFP